MQTPKTKFVDEHMRDDVDEMTEEEQDIEALGMAPDGSRMQMGDETSSGAPWHPTRDPFEL